MSGQTHHVGFGPEYTRQQAAHSKIHIKGLPVQAIPRTEDFHCCKLIIRGGFQPLRHVGREGEGIADQLHSAGRSSSSSLSRQVGESRQALKNDLGLLITEHMRWFVIVSKDDDP